MILLRRDIQNTKTINNDNGVKTNANTKENDYIVHKPLPLAFEEISTKRESINYSKNKVKKQTSDKFESKI